MRIRHALWSLLVACGGGSSDLDPDAVTSLPEGDAIGTGYSGHYRMTSLTTDCSGDCTTSVDGVVYSACDIGARLEDSITVTQTDGKLQIDVAGNDYVSRLDGGVFANAMFEVGGLRTQLGGSITITTRVTGSFASKLTGTARLRVSGHGLKCLIESEVTGDKR